MESRNPVFRGSAFDPRVGGYGAQPHGGAVYAPPAGRTMTIDDVVVRGFLTLVTLVVTAALAWALVPTSLVPPVLVVALIAEIGIWAFIAFGRKANAATVLAFAAVYGVVVGLISHSYNDIYHGVVFQAVVGTALAFGATLAVYALRIVRVTPAFARFVMAAGLALIGLMIVNWAVHMFGGDHGIGIRDPGNPLAYVFSVAAILVGCFFLLLDFDAVETGVRTGAPEKFAWFCAFGLVLSLVWIYLEVLRLLSYFSGRD
ncbi:putative YccA/Bax inhibitor family protein [Actinomadura coerulea]|uniref:Putative YccA/Bax inhibitor family protein n=1 Tax=Actinomadura coerulea TaxID=46159 RepID=A0A7X0L312_9ACTN|nr:Bax inhibitor-1/YccA family protein [Actinomadura coerulea]MBB6400082.1 putative YccA/Bax inhibitor family protein [Actinomadura coerulea]GGQ21906.1 membrane protein [Actinomadura coerulea]